MNTRSFPVYRNLDILVSKHAPYSLQAVFTFFFIFFLLLIKVWAKARYRRKPTMLWVLFVELSVYIVSRYNDYCKYLRERESVCLFTLSCIPGVENNSFFLPNRSLLLTWTYRGFLHSRIVKIAFSQSTTLLKLLLQRDETFVFLFLNKGVYSIVHLVLRRGKLN